MRHTFRSRIRNVRIVREHDRIQPRKLLWGLVGGLVIIVPLLGNVWGHAEAVRLGYHIQETRKSRGTLREINRLLRAEQAALRDLNRIQNLAIHELGLEPRLPSAT